MSNVITERRVHPGVAAIFESIDTLEDGHYALITEGDFGWLPVDDEWSVPLEITGHTLNEVRDMVDLGTPGLFCRFWEPDGTRVSFEQRTEEFNARELAPLPAEIAHIRHAALRTPGGLLFISDGLWYPSAVAEVDGEHVVTYVTRERHYALRRAAEVSAFLAAHPEIDGFRPAWAEDASPLALGAIEFAAQVGRTEIVRVDELVGDEWEHGSAAILVREDEFTASEARQLAADLLRAADALEAQA